MSPNPEAIGPGIFNVDIERQESKVELEINIIIKNAINSIKTKNEKLFFGLIAEYEHLPSGERKDYFHPVVTVHDEMIKSVNEGGFDDLALGGYDFKQLFPYNHETNSVDWQGIVGVKRYQSVGPLDKAFPLEEFFSSEEKQYFSKFHLYKT